MKWQARLFLSTVFVVGACTGNVGQEGGGQSAQHDLIAPSRFTTFESLQVRPLALAPSGQFLYAANTPDDRLEVFRVGKDGTLTSAGAVAVGMEPVAVAARSDTEIWVVNMLSDSVSVVDTSIEQAPRVVRTLLVGDEPRDIVFGGPNKSRAFITTAHRGQNTGDPYDLQTAGVGRADVWVFDATNLGAAAGGNRLTKITLFADTPRGLAVSADGSKVYAAAFYSGNQTTAVSAEAVARVYGGIMPGPATITIPGIGTIPMPQTGLVVKYNPADGTWRDFYNTDFSAFVKIRLPDKDVFTIDANATPPVPIAAQTFTGVGTTLFNLAVNPRNGKVYVSNTDAHNIVRFEGHAAGFSSVRGNFVDSRITVIDPASGSVAGNNLNPQIDHTADTGDPNLAVTFPQDLVVSSDGSTLYVVGQGSGKLAIYSTSALEGGTVSPTLVSLSAGGPAGVALDERRGKAYVLTRFNNSISTVDIASHAETTHVAMFNPEPASVTAGRPFLYDAVLTSAHGDQACAGCHIGGDLDALVWDLGNPGGGPLPITQTFAQESDVFAVPRAAVVALLGPQAGAIFNFYMPLKGPMTTQSLRGMDNHGSMHWRGDRNGAIQQTGAPFLDSGGNPVVSAQANAGIYDELNAFKSFNVAFPGLVGRAAQLTDAQMTAYAQFILQVTYPPNPVRALDDSLTPEQQAGAGFFFNLFNGQEAPVDHFHNCNGCHTLDRNGNAGSTDHPGFFGTSGRLSFENEQQIFKIPHLRNAYAKVGMFGSSPDQQLNIASVVPPLNPTVDATRSVGYLHDGTIGSLEHFLSPVSFIKSTSPFTFGGVTVPPNPFGIPFFANSDDPLNPAFGISVEGLQLRHAIAAYVLAFDTNMRPIVGQQITLTATNGASAGPRIDLLEARAAAGDCDLVVRGRTVRDTGWLYVNGTFKVDTSGLPALTDAQMRAIANVTNLTFTCTPPGTGNRLALDRDGDGFSDGDEILAHTDPANPASHP
jgi:YVTN family beta-propeller protein